MVVDDSFVSVRVVGRLRSIDGGGNVCFRGFSELTLQGSVGSLKSEVAVYDG